MIVEFNRWPKALEQRYRQLGYWIDLPLSDILTRQSDNGQIALICGDHQFSYAELNLLVDSFAAALQQQGVKRGQTALVQLGNEAEFYIVFFALLRLGVVPVNAIFSHQRNELCAYADQITPALLIADRNHSLFCDDDFIDELRVRMPSLCHVVLSGDNDDILDFETLLAQGAGDFIANPTPADEVAFFQLSGGSTGTPKLIPRTHNDYYYSIRASVEICQFNAETRYLCALPAAHNFPMSSPGALGAFYSGGQVILAHNLSADCCFPLIQQHQVNVAALIPPAVSVWLEAIALGGHRDALKSLRLLQVGGARLSESLARRIPKEMGCQLQQVFGMAEGLVNYTRLDDDEQHIFMTQGCPMSQDDKVWIADNDGNPVPPGIAGRLMTQGPYTFRGYYRSPQHNQQCFDSNGFYCSGDLVIMTPDGYLQVVGREKDQINRGGEKIAAEEVENLLLRHPDVIYAALVAVPDELMGEKSCAFVVLRKPIKAVVLRRYLREQGIADYKLPDRFESVPSLPTTPIGKIDKQQLRQLAKQFVQPSFVGERNEYS
ncbi:(2,3-dihydroxybenzoyl)adenylate synthase [Photorhabdus heterorhabditis]|uniref:(2,3-dihydroxybenzoyl)adenylate synthase n=1 Tax=Photorhabdus heterorhabditis TaxID=880156 RepID=A0A5B0WNS7_9GAMM|nr:(2,3-dihydroxybenzoyl)adenylate synthase [Photorhabdus heterorhabditis]KAA1187629.1 (2,3-dihydroxybenzoyl)adenylate synthase [Photorhabdus heterorhabditis]KOY62553.1 enterobactin synthase subunit E [Photorhabdus heterorhabditis]MBS9442693.1 (2,3-dihydroxybenzoyl)adenylate synthase [Photorhabdus heterorhabditis]